MKQKSLITASALGWLLVLPAAADVIYSNLQDISIPTDYAGVYLDIDTGNWNTNLNSPPTGWDFNPFFGGSALWNSPTFQPVRTGTDSLDAVVNLAEGVAIGSGSVFSTFVQGVGGENPGGPGYGYSETHLGVGVGQFVAGQEGYIGFQLNGTNYGWMRVLFTNNTGGALIREWAFDNSGAPIAVANVKRIGADVALDSTFGSFTLSSVINDSSGTTNLLKTGSGITTITGANTFTGSSTINTGVLNIRHANALGTTSSGTTVATGAALEIQGGITVGAEALTLNGSGVSSAGALRNISGSNNYGGLVTLGSSARINSDAGLLTLSNLGTITGDTFDLTVGGAGDTTINSIIGTTTGGLTKDGNGTLTLTGPNTYTGTTNLTSGTLLLGASNVLPNAAAFNLSGGAKLATGNNSDSTGSLSLDTTGIIDFASGSTNQLTFANTGAWNGILSIWNYTGGAVWTSSTGVKLNFTDNSLLAGDLANIQFYSGSGTGPIGSGAGFIGTELVPVPEPGAVLTGLLMLGLVSYRERRASRRLS